MKYCAPARIDLAGGTLDIPPLCFIIKNSITINLAINLHVFLEIQSMSPAFASDFCPEDKDLARLAFFREALDYFQCEHTPRIKVHGNIPPAAGLGGSSSTLVALVLALRERFQGKNADRRQVLNTVTLLENRLLGKPAGSQDAIAAIYGGLNVVSFESGVPERCRLPPPSFLKGPLYLAYSRVRHHSGINNWVVVKAACEGDPHTLRVLQDLNRNAHELRQALREDSLGHFMECMQREASLRKRLSGDIYTEPMARFAGALGEEAACKVCGAGGGGCMFVFAEKPDVQKWTQLARVNDLELLVVEPEYKGCLGVEA